MARRTITLVLWLTLLTSLVALTPLAYASPPDPIWVGGVFDDDDNDNGVFFVTSSTATIDSFPLCGWSLLSTGFACSPIGRPGTSFPTVLLERRRSSPSYFLSHSVCDPGGLRRLSH